MKHAVEDLSALARRGELDEAERRRLDTLLASSQEAKLLHDAGCAFDRESSVVPGDDRLAERIARGVLAQLAVTEDEPLEVAPPRRRSRVWLIALVACLTTGVAAASTTGVWLRFLGSAPPATREAERPSLPTAARAASPSAPPPPAPEEVELPSDEPRPAVARPGPRRAAERRTHTAQASALYAEASRARREGRRERAVALYRGLVREFPAAAEARAARMALGMLQLAGGRADEALREFEAYLSHPGGAELRSEALWGKARALEKLGREEAMERTLELLLREYPASAYAPAARARLGLRAAPP